MSLLFLFVSLGEHFWMGWSVFLGSFTAIAVLVYLAYRVPQDLLRARGDHPQRRPLVFGITGVLFYPSVIFTEFLGMGAGIPAALVFALVIIVQALFLIYVVRVMNRINNGRNLIAFAFGLILPIAVFGVLAEIRLPIILLAELTMIIFFRMLWKKRLSRPLCKQSTIIQQCD